MSKMARATLEKALALTQAIVDTVREPLLVLDEDLRVIAASRSFYDTFGARREETEGCLIYELGNRQWDIPALRELLDTIIPQNSVMEAYEVEHEFPAIGRRVVLLNARKIYHPNNNTSTLLLAMQDMTERRTAEREKDELLRQKNFLLKEMHHRVNNSLQIIASILQLKARTVQSEETRQHLTDAHQRVLAVAAAQEQLRPSAFGEQIDIGPYLTKLCDNLAISMIGSSARSFLEVQAEPGTMASAEAVSLGLIATELVINALKHAFPADSAGRIVVRYEVRASDWQLSVSDDGIGVPSTPARQGLGTSIVEALTRQLGGRVEMTKESPGTKVSVTAPR